MDTVVGAVINLFSLVMRSPSGEDKRPQFLAHGGTMAENLALQNIQVTATLGY